WRGRGRCFQRISRKINGLASKMGWSPTLDRAGGFLERQNMGAWGTGLYSSDLAGDMRAVIKSALRLPVDEDRVVEILSDCERGAAADPDNEDYTTFWLVLADQFEKRGVAHAPTREKALAILNQGDDLAMMKKLGMKQADLRKRGDK